MSVQPVISNNHADCSWHGHWVRHVATGREGRIGCKNLNDGRVAVCWDEGGSDWYRESDLEALDRTSEPWYRAVDLVRRRTNGQTDDIWWAAVDSGK